MVLVHGILLLSIVSLGKSVPLANPIRKCDPDCDYNITQMIQTKGYPCEEYKVTTNDGYILGLFRISHGRNSSSIGPPVLLQHGLLDSSTTWVMNFPEQSLGFILADAGYDVWLGNMRGNYYSRAHVKYNPDHDDAFWDFSFDEMAHDDLPSMIFYILNVTQHQKIAYVGHSQGTMIAFAEFGRMNNLVQNNVSFYAALAPIAQLGHIKSPIRYLSTPKVVKDIEILWHALFGRNEFLPSSSMVHWFGQHACGEVILDKLVCENVLFIFCGPEKKNMNDTRIPVYVSHEPDGTSVKNMVHYAQGIQSNIFQAYDYGTSQDNLAHYNQTTPPVYTLRPMKIPTAIFWSGNDWLADPVDVSYIFDNLGSLVYEKYIPDYNHLDFVWATSANQVFYPDLIAQMKKYHPTN